MSFDTNRYVHSHGSGREAKLMFASGKVSALASTLPPPQPMYYVNILLHQVHLGTLDAVVGWDCHCSPRRGYIGNPRWVQESINVLPWGWG